MKKITQANIEIRELYFQPKTQTFISRYQTDFEELAVVGKGASGQVVKAKNKIDGRIYAVKKIVIKPGQKLSRIMREAQTLSRLNHQNIIRYYQSWLEEYDETNDTVMTNKQKIIEDDEDSDKDVYGYKFVTSSYTSLSDSPSEGSSFGALEKKTSILYIQTEFCNQSLRDALAHRQEDTQLIWRWFLQILDALKYIHSQNIIHRDLKPGNIFLDSNGEVKIGDFGLATNMENISVVNFSQEIESLILRRFGDREVDKDITMGVGTYFYRAPEVDYRKNEPNSYDEKIDVYSLGITFFEMWHPFSNNLERIKILHKLKTENVLPKKFVDTHPRQTRLINMMLERDPNKRLTVEEIFSHELIPSNVTDHYHNEIVKIVSNPSTVFYSRLVEALFSQKPHEPRAQLTHETIIISTQEIFCNIIAQRVGNYLRAIGALPVRTPIFDTSLTASKSRERDCYGLFDYDPRVPYMNRNGNLDTLKINPRQELREMMKFAASKVFNTDFLNCYEVEDIYFADSRGQVTREKILSYDSFFFNDTYREVSMAQTISTALTSIHRMLSLYPNPENLWKNIKVEISNMKIVGLIFQSLGMTKEVYFVALKTLRAYFANEIDMNQAKSKLEQDCKLTDRNSEKLINLTSLKGTILECEKKLETNILNVQTLSSVFDELNKTISVAKLFYDASYGIYVGKDKKKPSTFPEFELNLSLIDVHYIFKKDLIFEIIYQDLKSNAPESLGYGGVYTFKMGSKRTQQSDKKASSPDRLDKGPSTGQKKDASGFSVQIEKVARILNFHMLQIQAEQLDTINHQLYYVYEAIVCADSAGAIQAKTLIASVLWHFSVTTFVYPWGKETSLEEQLVLAEKLGIGLVIIVREKAYQEKSKFFVKIKGEKGEKEFGLEDLEVYISKHYKK